MIRNLLSFFALFIVILTSACATTKAPGRAATESVVINHDPSLSVRSVRDYSYDYHQIAAGTAYYDVYVICGDCPPATKLRRELGEVPLSLFLGKERVVPGGTVSQQEPVVELPRPNALTAKPRPAERGAKESPESSMVVKSEPSSQSTITFCMTSPVLFDLDSSVLKESEKEKVMTSLGELRKAKEITVKGFTCDLGSKEHNDRLALERAQAVAVYLEEHGVRLIRIDGEGKCCYVSEDRSKNRRAEIYCLKLKGEQE